MQNETIKRNNFQASPRPLQKIIKERSSSCSNSGAHVSGVGVHDDSMMMDVAAKFVQDIIDRAKTEASSKLNPETFDCMSTHADPYIGLEKQTWEDLFSSRPNS